MKLEQWWDLLRITFREWWKDNTFRLAASLAFYTIFAMAPLIVITLIIVGAVFGGREVITRQMVGEISSVVGKNGGRAVLQIARAAHDEASGPGALALATGTLILGASAVFAELQAALNQVWDVRPQPRRSVLRLLLRSRLRSFAIATAVGVLLLVSLMLSIGLTVARRVIERHTPGVPWLWHGVYLVVGFAIITLLFAMIYKFLPDVKIEWREVIIGALVTATLFSAGKYLIGLYLGQMAVGSAYGAAGSLAVVLIWIYYSALISFFGAEFTQVYARRYGSRIRPESYAQRVGNKSDSL